MEDCIAPERSTMPPLQPTPAEPDQLGINAAQFLEQVSSMMEEYTTDCFCAVDEAILREPHGLSEQRQAVLLEGSSSLYDVAMMRVREENERFKSETLQGSLGISAGLDLTQNLAPKGTQATEGAAEEIQLEAEMGAMRTRLAVVHQEAQLLVDPAAKLRACLAANNDAGRLEGLAGSVTGKENMEDAAAVSSALQSLKPLLATAQLLQQPTVAANTGVSTPDQDAASRQDRPLPQLCNIPHGAVSQIMALLDQAG